MPRSGQPSGVVHLTAEFWPFARTGGLAEAVRGAKTLLERCISNGFPSLEGRWMLFG